MTCDRIGMQERKDLELVITLNEAKKTANMARRAEENGGVAPELANQLADDREVITVVRAVGRKRTLRDSGNAHSLFPSEMQASPKRQARAQRRAK